jgi:hypothetical protein
MPRFSFFASESCSVRSLVQSVLSAVTKIKLLPHPPLTADENLYIVADHRRKVRDGMSAEKLADMGIK